MKKEEKSGLMRSGGNLGGREIGLVILLMEEIRHPPVEVGSLSHSLQGFVNFQVMQDFFHQEYE